MNRFGDIKYIPGALKPSWKTLLVLAAIAGLFYYSRVLKVQRKDNDFERVLATMSDCANAMYKNYQSPSSENAGKRESECLKLEEVREELGLESERAMEAFFEEYGPGEKGWFYTYGEYDILNRKFEGYFAARIVDKTIKEGIQVYFTEFSKGGVNSPGGYLFNIEYMGTTHLSNGKKVIAMNVDAVNLNSRRAKAEWGEYRKNHLKLLKRDYEHWDSGKEQFYCSLKNGSEYYEAEMNSLLMHELGHAVRGYSEEEAIYAQLAESPIEFSDIWKMAISGGSPHMAAYKCISENEDMQRVKLAEFYLKAYRSGCKEFIQKRAETCSKHKG